jgi:hypothetical protein
MNVWQEFLRAEVRERVNAYTKRSGANHGTAWHHLYDAYKDQGRTVPDVKNKLQSSDGTALERLLTVAKTM